LDNRSFISKRDTVEAQTSVAYQDDSVRDAGRIGRDPLEDIMSTIWQLLNQDWFILLAANRRELAGC